MKRTYGDRVVEISNPDKPLFPDGTPKIKLIDYYECVAETLLPHVRRRPLTLYRCPDGIDERGESLSRSIRYQSVSTSKPQASISCIRINGSQVS